MKKTSRIFWGLGFITAAVFLVLLWRDILLSGACLADICRSAGASQSRFLECGDHRCIFDDRIQFFVSA